MPYLTLQESNSFKREAGSLPGYWAPSGKQVATSHREFKHSIEWGPSKYVHSRGKSLMKIEHEWHANLSRLSFFTETKAIQLTSLVPQISRLFRCLHFRHYCTTKQMYNVLLSQWVNNDKFTNIRVMPLRRECSALDNLAGSRLPSSWHPTLSHNAFRHVIECGPFNPSHWSANTETFYTEHVATCHILRKHKPIPKHFIWWFGSPVPAISKVSSNTVFNVLENGKTLLKHITWKQ